MVSRCEDDTVTGDFVDELPNFRIDTFSELEEHSGRFAEDWFAVSKMKKKSCVLCRNFVLKVSLTILSAHDDKIRIPARPCNIFYIYIFFHQWLQSFFYLVWSICQLYRYSSCLLFMYVFIYQFTYLLFAYKLSTYRFTYYQNVL